MSTDYRTVFEVSYFSNGTLLINAFCVFLGLLLGAGATFVKRRVAQGEAGIKSKCFYVQLIAGGLVAILFFVFISNVSEAHWLTSALKTGSCQTVDGTVQVLNQEPWSGHGQDMIKVGERQFGFSSHSQCLEYNRTISHGGELTDGTKTRLHYLGNKILKVEIQR